MKLTPEQIQVATAIIAPIGSYIVYKIATRGTRSLIREVLKDNNLLKDETKIKIYPKSITITHYKKIDTDQILKLPKVLEQETGIRYLLKRKNQKIILEKMKLIPKTAGVFKQNIQTGKIEKFSLGDLQHWNGVLVSAISGVGKSELVKALTEKKNTLVYSPKGSEDFPNGQHFSEQAIREINSFIDNYKNIKEETIIVIDEILTFISIVEKIDRNLLDKLSTNLTLNRSSNLKFIIITQKLNRTSKLDLSLLNYKLISDPSVGLYEQSLGIKPKTNMIGLKRGEFVLFNEGQEYIVKNNLSKCRQKELKEKEKNKSITRTK